MQKKMRLKDRIFSAWAYVRHRVVARNTLGYGIHSPYLFNLARAIFPCTHPYYAFGKIERRRAALLRCEDEIFVEDFGTGHSGKRRVCDIARMTLKPSREAQLLMRLAVEQGAKEIVELGTCLGISSAYLASAGSDVRLTTFEGAPEVAEIARKGWLELGLKNVECVVGDIDKTLPEWRPEGKIDMAFLDANHTYEATVRYFKTLLPFAHKKSIFVLDDIHYSCGMQRAWEEICKMQEVSATMDLYAMGLVFFDPNYEKKTYCIRL